MSNLHEKGLKEAIMAVEVGGGVEGFLSIWLSAVQ